MCEMFYSWCVFLLFHLVYISRCVSRKLCTSIGACHPWVANILRLYWTLGCWSDVAGRLGLFSTRLAVSGHSNVNSQHLHTSSLVVRKARSSLSDLMMYLHAAQHSKFHEKNKTCFSLTDPKLEDLSLTVVFNFSITAFFWTVKVHCTFPVTVCVSLELHPNFYKNQWLCGVMVMIRWLLSVCLCGYSLRCYNVGKVFAKFLYLLLPDRLSRKLSCFETWFLSVTGLFLKVQDGSWVKAEWRKQREFSLSWPSTITSRFLTSAGFETMQRCDLEFLISDKFDLKICSCTFFSSFR